MKQHRDHFWSLLNEGSALVATTLSFTLLGVALQPKLYGEFIAISAVVAPLAAFSNGGVFLTILDALTRSEEDDSFGVAQSCVGLSAKIGAVVALGAWVVMVTALDIDWRVGALLCTSDLVLSSIANSLVGVLLVRVGFVASAKPRVLFQLCRSVMFLVLWRTHNLRLLPYAICQVSLLTSYLAVTLALARRCYPHMRPVGPSRGHHFRSVMTYSVGISALGVQNDGDKFALKSAGFDADAGRYGMGYRVVQLGLLPVQAILGSTHVGFLQTSDTVRPLDRAMQLSRLLTVYAVVVMTGMWFGAPLVPKLLGHEYDQVTSIIRWLLPLIFFRGVGTFAMNGLLGLSLNHIRTRLQVLNAAFAVVLYILLVPSHSWRGAAAATLITEVSLFAMGWTMLIVRQRRADRGVQVIASQ